MSWRDYVPLLSSNDFDTLTEGLHESLGDADALALLPYDDGTFYLKQAYFDKDLLGGIGGYETVDEDKIALDGNGEAVKELFGVPILLAIDPTEHAAAVDPVKALIAHKEDIGEWIRVDRDGGVLESGPGIEPAPDIDGDGIKQRDEDMAVDGGTITEDGVTVQGEHGPDRIYPTPGTAEYRQAMLDLAKDGNLTKLYDIAPPASVVFDEHGDPVVEQATHIAVDQSKAADLMPTTNDTTELAVAIDKARMEEHDEGKAMKYATYGFIGGSVTVFIVTVVLIGLFSFSGGALPF